MLCAYAVILCGALEIPCHPNHQRSDITFQQSPSQNHLQMLRPSVANALVTNNTNETCHTFDCGFISERTAYTNFCLPLLATFRAIYHQALLQIRGSLLCCIMQVWTELPNLGVQFIFFKPALWKISFYFYYLLFNLLLLPKSTTQQKMKWRLPMKYMQTFTIRTILTAR